MTNLGGYSFYRSVQDRNIKLQRQLYKERLRPKAKMLGGSVLKIDKREMD